MKWDGCDFEKQASSSGQQCDHGDRLNMILMRGHLLRQVGFNDLQIRAAREAVKQGQSISKYPR